MSTCLVDGVDLANVPATAATPTPPSSTASGGAIAVPPPQSNSGGGGAMIALVAIVVVLLFGAGVVAMLVVMMSTGGDANKPVPDPEPIPVPVPVAQPVPVPVPLPEPTDAPTITLMSVPDDAEVWEGNTKLCNTPCTTPHPEHAPLPREFILKKTNYVDTTYAMQDPADDHNVALRRKPTQQPKPKTGPKLPRIDTER